MVRIKHRYLLFNVLYPEEQPHRHANTSDPPYLAFHTPSPAHLHSGLLLNALRSSIALHFGDVGVGLTSPSLKVVYFSPATSTAIVRCPRQHFRVVWAALTYMTTLPAPRRGETMPCVIQVVRVSGTIKKSEEELMRRGKRDIVRAKEWEQNSGNATGILAKLLGQHATTDHTTPLVAQDIIDDDDDMSD